MYLVVADIQITLCWPASTIASWIGGLFFFHPYRLGTVPLNVCVCRRQGDRRSRWCGIDQVTLPHVLNHYRQHMRAAWGRAMPPLIAQAVPMVRTRKFVVISRYRAQIVSDLRPDIVVVEDRDRRCHIVDEAIPLESRYEAKVQG